MRTALVSLKICHADVAVSHGLAGQFGRAGWQARLVGRRPGLVGRPGGVAGRLVGGQLIVLVKNVLK